MKTVSIPLSLAQHLFQRLRAEKMALAEMKKSFAPELQEELSKAIAQNHDDFTQMTSAIFDAIREPSKVCQCKQPETQPESQVCLACGGEWQRIPPRTWIIRAGHPAVGTRCPKCKKTFVVGDNTTITNIQTEDANTISGDQVHVVCPAIPPDPKG